MTSGIVLSQCDVWHCLESVSSGIVLSQCDVWDCLESV